MQGPDWRLHAGRAQPMGMLNSHHIPTLKPGPIHLEYAQGTCHDCGRTVSREFMQRHRDRQHSSTTFSVTKSGASRRSSERYSERDVLVCADCGARRTTWQWIKIIGFIVAAAVVIFLLLNARPEGVSLPSPYESQASSVEVVEPPPAAPLAEPQIAPSLPVTEPVQIEPGAASDQPTQASPPPGGSVPPNLEGLY